MVAFPPDLPKGQKLPKKFKPSSSQKVEWLVLVVIDFQKNRSSNYVLHQKLKLSRSRMASGFRPAFASLFNFFNWAASLFKFSSGFNTGSSR